MGRPHATRAQRASMRCEWRTKRPLPEYLHLSDNQLKKEIGATYGFKHLAVGRAIVNHSKDKLESDDEHCLICTDARIRARQKFKDSETVLASQNQDGLTQKDEEEPVKRRTNTGNVAPSGATPGLHDAIFVHSSDDDDGPAIAPRKRSEAPGSPLKSPSFSLKRRRRLIPDSDSDDSDKDAASSVSGSAQLSKKPHMRHSEASAEVPEIVEFLQNISSSYTLHSSVLAELGISTREHLKGIQSMGPQARASLFSRMEKRGLSALECAMIEDAIIKM